MKKIILILIFTLLSVGCNITKTNKSTHNINSNYNPRIKHIDNYEHLFRILQERNIPYPEIWVQVAIVESGWCLDSDIAKNANNLFGFIFVPEEHDISNYYGYSSFKDIEHCIEYLEYWIYRNPVQDYEDGYAYLKRRNYNTENYNYLYMVKSIRFWEKDTNKLNCT